jgi:hypothetical protein
MSRKQKPRAHTFMGEEQAAVIVNWLSDPIRPPNDLIEKWVVLEEQLPMRMLIGEETNSEISKLINDEVERLGLAWTWRATPTRTSYDLKFSLALRRKLEPWEALLASVFLQARILASQSLLGRIRRCLSQECGRWFYAKLEQQRFHSNECRRSALSADPKWKQQRATWMREHRRTKKLLVKKKKGGK